jgi:branched-chain amino acid transport system permease protein
MMASLRTFLIFICLLALTIAAPFLLPAYKVQLAFMWVMILFALTWDVNGGQMGYNSFGNVVFFGIGCYVCAVVQRDWGLSYYPGLFVGALAAGLAAVAFAAILGSGLLALRGQYFAIATLGLGVAAGESAAAWDYIGAGSGMTTPVFPGQIDNRQTFFYFLCAGLGILCFVTLRRLYRGRFHLAINAIRDDEDKAEAMGLRTTLYKTIAWSIAAFFLGLSGAIVGNLIGFIDARDVAFAGTTYGVWMVLMAILGGKGTLWGPVIGAIIFHITQEFFWTYFLGWQRVALGFLIVVIVVFFPVGIMGWLRQHYPSLFGEVVEDQSAGAGEAAIGGAALRSAAE